MPANLQAQPQLIQAVIHQAVVIPQTVIQQRPQAVIHQTAASVVIQTVIQDNYPKGISFNCAFVYKKLAILSKISPINLPVLVSHFFLKSQDLPLQKRCLSVRDPIYSLMNTPLGVDNGNAVGQEGLGGPGAHVGRLQAGQTVKEECQTGTRRKKIPNSKNFFFAYLLNYKQK